MLKIHRHSERFEGEPYQLEFPVRPDEMHRQPDTQEPEAGPRVPVESAVGHTTVKLSEVLPSGLEVRRYPDPSNKTVYLGRPGRVASAPSPNDTGYQNSIDRWVAQ
jgi:hypothetical protein